MHRKIIVVDDGMATGSSVGAAIASLRQEGVKQIVSVVPMAAQSVCALIDADADDAVCLLIPVDFYTVTQSYQNFSQTIDQEVRGLVHQRAS
jgi:putative phosphoribosyl transferase